MVPNDSSFDFFRAYLVQSIVVEKIGSMSMNQGAPEEQRQSSQDEEGGQCQQSKPILPAIGKVLHVHFLVRGGLALTPKEQAFFCGEAFFTTRRAFRNLRYTTLSPKYT